MRNLQEFGSRQFNPLKNQQNFDMIQTVLELVYAIKYHNRELAVVTGGCTSWKEEVS
jgi:hypothetical protein